MKGTHVMLDFETLGQRPSTTVLSLGAVLFSKEDGVIKTHEWFFDPKEQLRKQRTLDFDTLSWWSQQSDEARKVFTKKDLTPMSIFHKEFKDFFGNQQHKLWGNGSDFDVSILTHMWQHHKQDFPTDPPWKFWDVRCFRTFNAMTKCKELVKMEGIKHSALDDARYQALCVIEGLRKWNL